VYHSPEGSELGAMIALVETGRLTPDHLSLMLVRKHDWHDYDGLRYLLEHGADPNQSRGRGILPLHHGIARDNARSLIELELDYGADPLLESGGFTAIERAALRGRGDLLALFQKRGFDAGLQGVNRLIAACARGDPGLVQAIARDDPATVAELLTQGSGRLAEFAGTWNDQGVELLLDLGVPVAARYEGDGYFDLAPETTALHVAAWKGLPSTVRLLLCRGAPVNAVDARGRTPLMLAVKATVESYWTERRTPHSVRALLDAGASLEGVKYPCGYDAVDALLAAAGARPHPT
jgi:ankyrin repeat protein